jgi:hypothetical protein
MIEQLRNAAKNKANEPRTKPLGTHRIILTGHNEKLKSWDIVREEQTLLLTSSNTDSAPVFERITAHVRHHNDFADFVAIDLKGRINADADEFETERTAVDIEEAHALSIHLLKELGNRAREEAWEQNLLILIKDGNSLFTLENPDKANLYYELLTNLQAVIVAGAMFGMKVLMEVDAATVTEASTKDFANKISI